MTDDKQTQIPSLGRPPIPRFPTDEKVPPFRAKRHLPFSLPGPIAMMLGPDGGDQIAEVMGVVIDWGSGLLNTLVEIRDSNVRIEAELRGLGVLLALAREEHAAELHSPDCNEEHGCAPYCPKADLASEEGG